ncbi:OLC1v1030839C1 [Oldenlandia corymbosa var. corymbosa]|uniref:OLC1v1030839C1 n=1 Tax=Oldenlandia corymbosa var. corymbosa TaxID=529605 RepID=A0AAV1CHN6_OLDCO|nr:OLC1v1030839C1 [Oldenlandia corymbosa var. corymbosa]
MASRVFGNGCRRLMAAAKTSVASSAGASKGAGGAKKPAVARGILKPQPVSPSLGQFLGASEASRTEAVKKIWDYVKSHNLQNPENKREIFCDEKLKMIFEGKDTVGFTEIAKLLSKHFSKSA